MLFSNHNSSSLHASDSISLSDNDSILRSEPVSISRSQSRPESCHSSSLGSAVSTDHEPRPVSVTISHHHSRHFPIPNHEPLSSSINLLSSSLPSVTQGQLSMSQKSSGSKRPANATSKQHHQRSRSSIDSLSKLLPPPHPETSENRVVTGWFKIGDILQEKLLYLGQVSDGLTVVVVYDPPKVSHYRHFGT
jgi:hypothetical protein